MHGSLYLSTAIIKKSMHYAINAQSASLRSLVAAESKAAEIKVAVACFESVCQLLTDIFRMCMSFVDWNSSPSFLAPPSCQIKLGGPSQ